jgi:UDP-N-acetylglucosamine 2-epimerase (non-hydrolysing)
LAAFGRIPSRAPFKSIHFIAIRTMKKLKVMSVVGTRPEIIRLSRVLARLDEHCDHVLVHTGQNYDFELNQVFFDDLGVRKPDFFLNSAENSGGVADTIGNLIIGVDKVLASVQPEAMLVLGDTNSCLSVIPAKRRKVPIFHMEAGNRCFDQRVPEETNRRIVDHTADVNLTYSAIAREYLLREGLPPDMVIKTGSPMFEVLSHYRPQIEASDILTRLGLQERSYFVVSSHREENIESGPSFAKLVAVIGALAEDHGLPVIVSTHPRTQKRIDATGSVFHPLVRLLKPLGFHDYNKLQVSARAVLSDSGTINEESSIMNFPALNLREAHERPEGMEEGAVMMVGLEVDRIRQGLSILQTQPRGSDRTDPHGIRQVADYSMPNVSDKVLRIIHSYTDYVKRVVWKKY